MEGIAFDGHDVHRFCIAWALGSILHSLQYSTISES